MSRTTPQINDLIGWMKKNNRAARAARLLVQFFDVVWQATTWHFRAHIKYWRFLDDWKDCFRWKTEHDASITFYSHTSKTAWGGTLRLSGHTLESRDYRLNNSQHINVLEAQPLLHLLLIFREHLTSSRVRTFTPTTASWSVPWRMEAAEVRIVCCQIALGTKSNALPAPTRSHVLG